MPHTRLLALLGVLFLLVVVKFFVLDLVLPPADPVFVSSQDSAVPGGGHAVSGMPTLVDLSTDWCGPCRQLEPVLLKLRKEYEGRAAIVIVNPEKDATARAAYRPRAYPTLVFHKADGSVHKRVEGSPGREGIIRIFKEMGVQ
ncbi:thioredoxin family protein [Megalodesulfovibrio paquesii]